MIVQEICEFHIVYAINRITGLKWKKESSLAHEVGSRLNKIRSKAYSGNLGYFTILICTFIVANSKIIHKNETRIYMIWYAYKSFGEQIHYNDSMQLFISFSKNYVFPLIVAFLFFYGVSGFLAHWGDFLWTFPIWHWC